MDFSSRNDYASALTIPFSESELRRLSQSERDLEARLASARGGLQEAISAREMLLIDGATMLNERALGAAEDRVKSAEAVIAKLEEALASVRRERDLAQQRLEAANDQARRLDEAASIALLICEIVDALKAFERASDRFASALEGSCGKATHTAPFVAASLRISKTRFATEARSVLSDIESYRAGLIDGSVKLKDRAPFELSGSGREPTRAHQFVASEPAHSIVPPPVPPPASLVSGAQRAIA